MYGQLGAAGYSRNGTMTLQAIIIAKHMTAIDHNLSAAARSKAFQEACRNADDKTRKVEAPVIFLVHTGGLEIQECRG
ncbi:hypothetical+protein [Methylocapsa aurea]